ncbi:hypothetical protein [Aestuariivirga sp.]|uniref:hypothetical protein n=1 Tax=Aestuariivirga sp. TaxID=2650926 RepID=UPI0039E42B2D
MKLTPKARLAAIQALCVELPMIHHRLVECGLYATAHKMHDTVRSIGFEAEREIVKIMKPTLPEGEK